MYVEDDDLCTYPRVVVVVKMDIVEQSLLTPHPSPSTAGCEVKNGRGKLLIDTPVIYFYVIRTS